jgi:hypothetical protein
MGTNVFISYRRKDSAGYAGRLMDRLKTKLGQDLLFMDVETIPLGSNFEKVLHEEIGKCRVLLALIGPTWCNARDENGKRRLDDQNDFVRMEISAALQRDIPVIPILLDGATMPKADQLPNDLRGLTSRNGLDVRHASFHEDMDRLIHSLKAQVDQSGAPRFAKTRVSGLSNRNDARAKSWLWLGGGLVVAAIGAWAASVYFFPLERTGTPQPSTKVEAGPGGVAVGGDVKGSTITVNPTSGGDTRSR